LTNPVLTIENLTVTYGVGPQKTAVIRDVSLDIQPGEIFGLVGESGSGKSTVAKSILRILGGSSEMTARQMTCDGFDILRADATSLGDLRWKRVSFVPQSALNSLNPLHTIGRHFDQTLRTHGVLDASERKERSLQGLEDVQLPPYVLHAYPHQLSGGMRQRVAIAMALLLRPSLILMDEPTTALDVVVQQEVILQVLRLRKALGFAVLFITHDLSLLFEIADRMAVMCKGEIVERGTAEAILNHATHPYTQHLLARRPRLDDMEGQ